jgi:hypothetical protein
MELRKTVAVSLFLYSSHSEKAGQEWLFSFAHVSLFLGKKSLKQQKLH